MSDLDAWLDVALDDDRRMILDMVADLAGGVVDPVAQEIDAAEEIPAAVLDALGEGGLLALSLPEDLGGFASGPLCFALAVAEIARASAPVGLHLMLQSQLVLHTLAEAGATGAAREHLDRVAVGAAAGAFAHGEASNAAGADGVAARVAAGKLDGEKVAVLGAGRAEAFLVTAREDDALALYLVPKDAPGVSLSSRQERLGMRGVDVHDVHFAGVAIAEDMRLATGGRAERLVEAALDRARLGVAAIAAGLIRSARGHAARYATERRQFDRPIADFEAIRERLAGIECGAAGAYAMLAAAAGVLASGRPATQICELAKIVASEAAMRAADDALQVYGGYGYSEEYPVERLYRDARWLGIAFGGNDSSRVRVAGRILPG